MTADLVDYSPTGVGIAVAIPLAVGTVINLNGKLAEGDDRTNCDAHVAWCLEKQDGSFRAGLQFEDIHHGEPWQRDEPLLDKNELEDDYYEVLQLSANATPDTIHRVYRMLAQRFHPDNAETGDEEVFKRVLAAYRILSDPETRAAFDARRLTNRRVRWRIFDRPEAAQGIAAEKRKRDGILSLLYTHRLNEPEHPQLAFHELEDLLGCPRDHLQVSFWYLKEKGLIRRDDRGRYEVTAAGVDEVEGRESESNGLRGLIAAPEPEPA